MRNQSKKREGTTDEKFKKMAIDDEKAEGRPKEAHLTSVQQEGPFKIRGVFAG